MAEKINYNDLFSKDVDKGIKQLIADLNKLEKEMKDISKSAKSVKVANNGTGKAYKENAKAIEDVNSATKFLIAKQKEKLKIEKAILSSLAKKNQATTRNAKLLIDQKEQVRKLNMELKDSVRADKAKAGSLEQLEARLRKARRAYAQLSAAERNNAVVGGKLKRQIDALANSTDRVRSSMKQFQQRVGNYSGALSKLKKSFGGLASAISPVTLGVAAVGVAMRKFFNVSSGFQKQMSEVKAITGTTGEQFEELSASAKKFGSETSFTASEVGKLQVELAKLSFTQPEILAATDGILSLAKATGTELAEAAAVTATTLRGFGIEATDTDRVVNLMAKSFTTTALDMEKFRESMKVVAPVAQAAGVSIEDTTAMLGTLANAGISGSAAGTALRRILSDMSTEGVTAAEAIANLSNKGITMSGAMDEVGRSAQTALLVLAAGTEKTDELGESFRDLNNDAKNMAQTMGENLAGDLDIANSALEGLILSMDDGTGNVNKFSRGIVQLSTQILNSLTVGNSWTKALNEYIQIFKDIFNNVKKIIGVFFDFNSEVSALSVVFDILTGIFYATTFPIRVIFTLVGKLTSAVASFLTYGKDLIVNLKDWVTSFDFVNTVLNKVSGAYTLIINKLKEFLITLGLVDEAIEEQQQGTGRLNGRLTRLLANMRDYNAANEDAVVVVDDLTDSQSDLNTELEDTNKLLKDRLKFDAQHKKNRPEQAENDIDIEDIEIDEDVFDTFMDKLLAFQEETDKTLLDRYQVFMKTNGAMINEYSDMVLTSLENRTQAELDATNQSLELSNTRLEGLKSDLDQEIALNEAGVASNIDGVQAEIQAEKDKQTELEAAKLKEETRLKKLGVIRKRAAQAEIAVNLALELSSLARAAGANPLNGLTFGAAGATQFAINSGLAIARAGLQLATVDAAQFADGTEFVPLNGNKKGTDTIPAFIDEGERILSKKDNAKLPSWLKNKDLPSYVMAGVSAMDMGALNVIESGVDSNALIDRLDISNDLLSGINSNTGVKSGTTLSGQRFTIKGSTKIIN